MDELLRFSTLKKERDRESVQNGWGGSDLHIDWGRALRGGGEVARSLHVVETRESSNQPQKNEYTMRHKE